MGIAWFAGFEVWFLRCSGAVDRSGRSLLSFSWSLLRIVVVLKVRVKGSLVVAVEGRRKRVMRRGADILLLDTLLNLTVQCQLGVSKLRR